MARRLADGLLVIRDRIELAGAAARAGLADGAAPRGLFEVDALHRLENSGPAHGSHVSERRWKARRRWLIHAACESAVVAARDEMRHPQGDRAVLDVRVGVAMAERRFRFACAEALGDDRAQMIVDHLVESAVSMGEVRC